MKREFRVLFLVGPTGVGKSALALKVARQTQSPILNADSVQVYSKVQIGAAKPTEQEQKEVPHYLVGTVNPPVGFTAGDFRREALEVLSRLDSTGTKASLIVGGSGFYLKALESGMFESGKVPHELQAQIAIEAKEDLSRLYKELQRVDPAAAERIHAHDAYRIQRAIEIWRHFGVSSTEFRGRFAPEPFPYPRTKLGLFLERESLRRRVDLRTKSMLKMGLVEEVQSLLKEGLREWPPLRTVGYREVVEFLDGKISQSALADAIVTSTMQLAKRQMTWFKKDSEIRWFNAEQEDEALRFALDYVRQSLDTEQASSRY